MASLEAGLSGWPSAEPPLHAFSLGDSLANPEAGCARGPGWRRVFGDLWSQVALGDLVGRHADPTGVGRRAKRHLEVVQRDLLGLWNGSEVSRRSVLRSAVVPLECSAPVWQASGPVAGQRHLHLLRRLEQTLARMQTCEPNAVLRTQQLALRRLAQALAAIWTKSVRSPVRASRSCR